MSTTEQEEDSKAEKEWDKAEKEADSKAEKDWDKAEKEADIKAEASKESEAIEEEQELQPHRRKIHRLFYLISVVAMLAALAMVVGQILGLIFKNTGPIQWVLRAYVIGLSFLVLFTEMEMTKLARENVILHNWICRGLIYSFIGVIGLEENDASAFRKNPPLGANFADYLMSAVCWIIIGVGAIYFVMGLLCIQRRYESERLEYSEQSAQVVLAMRDLRRKKAQKKAPASKAQKKATGGEDNA